MTGERVAVLGAGSIAFANAALLAQRGFTPVLWSPSGARTAALSAGAPLQATGAVEGAFSVEIARTCAEAIGGAMAVVVAVPGFGHRAVFDAAIPHLRPSQTVVISSHCSLGALYLARRGVRAPIAALGTTVATARQTSPTSVHINNVRRAVDVAALPASRTAEAAATCTALFGDRFVARDDVLAIALSNINPEGHMGMALCNFTRIERGETWRNYWGMTPYVGRLIEALDAERLGLAARFGVTVRTIHEHFHLSYGVPHGTMGEMAAAVDATGNTPNGPASVDTRYIYEDVPFGLVVTEAIGRIAGCPTPLHTAGIEIFSGLYGRDFRDDNDLLPALGLDGLDAASLHERCRSGLPT
jgi:opine dehydrogenase